MLLPSLVRSLASLLVSSRLVSCRPRLSPLSSPCRGCCTRSPSPSMSSPPRSFPPDAHTCQHTPTESSIHSAAVVPTEQSSQSLPSSPSHWWSVSAPAAAPLPSFLALLYMADAAFAAHLSTWPLDAPFPFDHREYCIAQQSEIEPSVRAFQYSPRHAPHTLLTRACGQQKPERVRSIIQTACDRRQQQRQQRQALGRCLHARVSRCACVPSELSYAGAMPPLMHVLWNMVRTRNDIEPREAPHARLEDTGHAHTTATHKTHKHSTTTPATHTHRNNQSTRSTQQHTRNTPPTHGHQRRRSLIFLPCSVPWW